MSKKVDVYTLAELKEQYPEAYDKVHERWKEHSAADQPWADETMDSLRKVVEACGGTMRDWSIGAYGPSRLSVDADDTYEHEFTDADGDEDSETFQKDADWLLQEVLAPLGYVDEHGAAAFPGLCKLTGYCADDDFLEAVHKAMVSGDTLTEALEGLASDAQRLMEGDAEQAADEESMEANWGDSYFTEDGHMVR